jgi:hypothetical protein
MEGKLEPMSARGFFSALPSKATTRFRRWLVWTRLEVTAACAVGAAVLVRSLGPEAALSIPTVLLGLSAVWSHHDRVGSQLLVRAVFWANLVLGTLIAGANSSTFGSFGDPLATRGLVLSLTLGTALLSMGHLGLDEQDGSAFRPVAFRGTLTLGMVMAVADAEALALFGAAKLELAWPESGSERLPEAAMLLATAALLACAIAGLYRLRVWGLLLSAAGAAIACALSLTDAYGLPSPFGSSLAVTSATQIALSLPVFVAILRGRPVATGRWPSRLARVVPALLVALLMTTAVTTWMLQDGPPRHAQ